MWQYCQKNFVKRINCLYLADKVLKSIISAEYNILYFAAFASAPYTISKEEEQHLRHRIESQKATLSPKQSSHLTMITTYGVAYGKHSGIVQKEVKKEDLFK